VSAVDLVAVGILRPDWLANATALGPSVLDGRSVCGWTKVDFIDYFADAETSEPVRWCFHTMNACFDTIYWAPGLEILNSSWFSPPHYCAATEEAFGAPASS